MNQVNIRKLLHSKWTAVDPEAKEKHFVVVDVLDSAAGVGERVLIEAIYTGETYSIFRSDLKDNSRWITGWK